MNNLTTEEILSKYNSLYNKYRQLEEDTIKLKNDQKELIERINYNTEETIEEQKMHIHKLQEDISGYKMLRNKGNVYNLSRNENLMTFKILFHYALKDKYDCKKIQYYSSFKAEEKSNGDTILSLKLKNRKSHYFILTKIIADKYFEENGKCSPRSKSKNSVEGMIKGRVGLHNEYPLEYIKYIQEYEELVPLHTWEDLPKHIIRVDNGFKCECCDTHIQYKSIRKHIQTNKHKKNM